ncbi:hypothetical protein E3N88_08805 [Mikania micrantha]|uniref:Uncharacterized protein n=1 Tax=Mikania micrantha TaxID=192012 RepID=A0A5N6PHA0_9ASTR|nr:hypothetical protein E3N88_08805 [Mikania micrantha]
MCIHTCGEHLERFSLYISKVQIGNSDLYSSSLSYPDARFNPLGLSDPKGTRGFIEPKQLAYGEVINRWFAMLGASIKDSQDCHNPESMGKQYFITSYGLRKDFPGVGLPEPFGYFADLVSSNVLTSLAFH